jgi:hypothetical protein
MQQRNADLLEAVEDMDYVKALKARLEAVKPYLRHTDLCITTEAETHELHMESRCTCGLRKALEQSDEQKTKK